jgi:hypothetical protein
MTLEHGQEKWIPAFREAIKCTQIALTYLRFMLYFIDGEPDSR